MCDFCEKEAPIFRDKIISPSSWGWAYDNTVSIKYSEIVESDLEVFIDTRGYLRIGDPSDSQCLDGGQKIRIKFCPFCGNKIT